jgi:hypothetical protein
VKESIPMFKGNTFAEVVGKSKEEIVVIVIAPAG